MIIDGTMEKALGSAHINGNRLVLTEQLGRKDYLRVNEILETLGGKWSRKEKAHLFPEEGENLRGLLETVIDTGEIQTARERQKELGWFPTPWKVADSLVALADIRGSDHVLEPSAGEGAIVDVIQTEGAIRKAMPTVTTVEIDPKRHKHLCKRFPFAWWHHVFGDFLHWKGPHLYDRVVMNPPFGPHLAHIEHALSMLRVGGKLASVAPISLASRQDKRHTEFFALLHNNAGRWAIHDLPADAFKISGTAVRTCMLVVEGWGR